MKGGRPFGGVEQQEEQEEQEEQDEQEQEQEEEHVEEEQNEEHEEGQQEEVGEQPARNRSGSARHQLWHCRQRRQWPSHQICTCTS